MDGGDSDAGRGRASEGDAAHRLKDPTEVEAAETQRADDARQHDQHQPAADRAARAARTTRAGRATRTAGTTRAGRASRTNRACRTNQAGRAPAGSRGARTCPGRQSGGGMTSRAPIRRLRGSVIWLLNAWIRSTVVFLSL